jgi:hypothetical protein
VHLYRGRIQTEGLDLDAHDLFQLQLLEDMAQGATFGPAIHAHIDGVPVAESPGKPTPLAALLGHIQNSVEHLKITQTHVPTLNRQAISDLFVLLSRDFHL